MPSFGSLLLCLLAIPLASAAAARRATRVHYDAAAMDSAYHWTVDGWTAACRDGACSYAFNVSGPYTGGNMPAPAFAASCAGAGVGAPYRFCQLLDGAANTTTTHKRRQVAARLLDPGANATAATARLAVSFQFDDLNSVGAWWNYTAYATHAYGQNQSFTMVPSEVYGVA